MAHNNIHEKDSDIVIVDLDDESYRLIPWTYPYPRGDMWARVLENLSLAGAKVIVFDFEFDAKDQKSEYLKNLNQTKEFSLPIHGDLVFSNAN